MAEKRILRVFLSYAHADRNAVKDLYNRLRADGVDAWLDEVELLPGQNWKREIHKAVRKADAVVVCLSCQYDDNGFRHQEVRIALEEAASQPEGEIFIIPARLEECKPLESLEQWHRVDLFEADGYEKLMRALQMRADSLGVELRLSKGSSSVISKKPVTKGQTKPKKSSTPGQKKETASQSKVESTKQAPVQSPTRPNSSIVPKPKERKPQKTDNIIAIIGVAATLIAGILSSPVTEKWFSNSPEASATATFTLSATLTPVVFPSQTHTPTATPTETATSTTGPTPTKTIVVPATYTSTPTNTITPSRTVTPSPDYSCVTVNEQPAENTQIRRGKTFKVMFTVVNNGATVWPENLVLDISSNPYGTVYAPSLPMKVPRVQPNDYIIVGPFDAKAPNKDGHYVVDFQLGDSLCWPYIAFDVIK